MSQNDFIDEVCTGAIIDAQKQMLYRDIPDTFHLDKAALLPLEPNFGILLRNLDHTFCHYKLEDITSLQFNWLFNDSKGYIVGLKNKEQLLLTKDKAYVGHTHNMQVANQMYQNAYKHIIVYLKTNLQKMNRKVSVGYYEIESPMWINIH